MVRLGSANLIASCARKESTPDRKIEPDRHEFNSSYSGKSLDRIAFPIGGMGAGMFCLEGTGAISHMSIHNRPEVFNEPCMFAAISVKGLKNGTKVIEGQVPDWKKFGQPDSANGSAGAQLMVCHGFRMQNLPPGFHLLKLRCMMTISLLMIHLTGWSPFIPTDADNSSLPAGAFEYSIKNTGSSRIEAMFAYNSRNFMSQPNGVNKIQSYIKWLYSY